MLGLLKITDKEKIIMLNRVQLIGFVGSDPKVSENFPTSVSFTLATSEKWFDKNTKELKESSTWHNIVIFNEKLKEVAQNYVKKGSKIFVEGSISKTTYKNKNGEEVTSFKIILPSFRGDLILLSEKKSSEMSQPGVTTREKQHSNFKGGYSHNYDLDDEIPV